MTTKPEILDQLTAQRNALERHRAELLKQLEQIESQLADLGKAIARTRGIVAFPDGQDKTDAAYSM